MKKDTGMRGCGDTEKETNPASPHLPIPITPLPSPNHDSRDGHAVDMLVLHYTGMPSAKEALARLRDPAARVSAHYAVDEDGSLYRLVAEERRAWHAGVSAWRGQANINQRSIGIEIVNPGHEFGYRPFPAAQMEAAAALCLDILARHPIPARNVVGHSDVAPARKEDPGELFDWRWLAEQGAGLWPDDYPAGREASAQDLVKSCASLTLAQDLYQYGYDTADLPKAILAFQRHFRPGLLNGEWDMECQSLLQSLLDSGL